MATNTPLLLQKELGIATELQMDPASVPIIC